MLKSLIAIFKLILLLFISLLAWLLSTTIFYICPRPIWIRIVQAWACCMRIAAGVKLQVDGKTNHNYQLKNYVIVANHMSWLDTIILYCIYSISFVGKSEMQRWPLLSTTIRAGGTIFINRQNKRDIIHANQQVSHKLASGSCVGFFPEGKVNDGKQLLPFKAPLLEVAITANSTVIPILLLYYRRDGSFAHETLYHNKNLVQAVLTTLRLPWLQARAIVLPSVNSSNFASRHELAEYLYQQMQYTYALQIAGDNLSATSSLVEQRD